MLDGGTFIVERPDTSCLAIPTTVHLVVKLDHNMVALARALLRSENLLSKPVRDRRTQIPNRTRCTVNPLGQLLFIHFARLHPASPSELNVYNPRFEQHGWQSTHTIVEIVTDDMSFLVDSVRMAVNRRSLTTHQIIHPVVKLRRGDTGELLEVSIGAARLRLVDPERSQSCV